MKKILSLFLLMILFNAGYSQKMGKKWCTVGDNDSTGTHKSLINIPAKSINTRLNDQNGVIIVPVVFHVLYHHNIPAENIPDVRINEQITRLNEDFRAQNIELTQNPPMTPQVWINLPSDLKFEFKLACIDPGGNPTNGIERKLTTNPQPFCGIGNGSIGCPSIQLSALYGADAWPNDTYLNVWVGDVEGGGGFALLPEFRLGTTIVNINGIPTTFNNSSFDGIILDYRTIGINTSPDFNEGRVGTHEVGHWLGLYHTFSGCFNQGDFVADTPPEDVAVSGCPTFPQVGFTCSTIPPGVMFMNYMDYTSDPCKYLYTIGQKDRARSYFSQNGPTGTRFPFIDNYFGIKRFASTPYVVQNNIITVYMKNPACLGVTYSFTGPVTEINHDDQKISFFVPCPSTGALSLTATSGNYIDDYTFNFVNPTNCTVNIWPKSYAAENWFRKILTDNSGNIFTVANGDMTTNVNHTGALPSSLGFYTVQYNRQTGLTSWYKSNMFPGFSLNSGSIQTQSFLPPGTTSFYNGITGQPSAPPSLVPANEIILAETSAGGFITKTNSNIYVHTNLGSTSISFITSAVSILNTFYNPTSQKLFVEYQGFVGSFTEVRTIAVYQLSNNSLTLINNPSFPTADNHQNLASVNGNDVVFTYSNTLQQIFEHNFMNGSFTPISIPGLLNSNIHYAYLRRNRYTENNMLVVKTNENKLYSINTVTNQLKKIAYTYSSPVELFPEYDFMYDGNDIYIVGNIEGQVANGNLIIGTQTIPYYFNISSFITKFNLINDFEFRSQSGITSKGVLSENKNLDKQLISEITDEIQVFPNPANSKITVTSGSDLMTYFLLSDIYGNILLRKSSSGAKNFIFSVDNLTPGVYYCSIKTNKGLINKKIVVIR